MHVRGFLTSTTLLPILLFAAASAVNGQQTAALAGTVTDISGAVIPGARITARPVQAGSAASATTDAAGAFQFAALPAGDYLITATAPGFAPAQVTIAAAAQTAPLHLTLGIAQAS